MLKSIYALKYYLFNLSPSSEIIFLQMFFFMKENTLLLRLSLFIILIYQEIFLLGFLDKKLDINWIISMLYVLFPHRRCQFLFMEIFYIFFSHKFLNQREFLGIKFLLSVTVHKNMFWLKYFGFLWLFFFGGKFLK